MPAGSPDDRSLPPASSVGPFLIGELLSSTTHDSVYAASEPALERNVLVRVATAEAATVFAADARRIAAVSHPNLVAVLAADVFEHGAYAASPDIKARPLRDIMTVDRLTTRRAAQIARGVAAASEALAASNLRVPIDLDTVVVAASSGDERGLLDPLRAVPGAGSRLSEADTATSARELADLLAEMVREPSEALRNAIELTRSGVLKRPRDLAEALDAIPLPGSPRRSRGPGLVIAACGFAAVAAIAVGALLLATRDDGEKAPAAKPVAPAGRVLARIPLGLTGKETAAALAIAGQTIWVTTNQGRLLHVDARSNQLVGNGLKLAGKQSYLGGIVSSGGSLWVTAHPSLLRLDPKTGRTLGKIAVGGKGGRFLAVAVRAGAGILWLPGNFGAANMLESKGGALRVDPARMRAIGDPLPAPQLPFVSAAGGKHAWLIGLADGLMTRLSASSGARSSLWVGPAPTDATLAGGSLWVTDSVNSTVTPIDAATMRFTREAVRTGGFANSVAGFGNDIWVLTSTGERGAGIHRVERIDTRTGRRSGRPLAVPRGLSLSVGLGSLWVLGENTLTRVAPTSPRPELAAPRQVASGPRPLQPGPLAAGTWNASKFVAPLTLEVPHLAWIAAPVPAADNISLGLARRPGVSVSVTNLGQVFLTYTKLERARSPRQVLTLLRRNEHLAVGSVRTFTLGGHSALQVALTARNPQANFGACGPVPCVPLFPFPDGQEVVLPGVSLRLTVLEVGGHVLAISESANAGDARGLTETASLVRTFDFAG